MILRLRAAASSRGLLYRLTRGPVEITGLWKHNPVTFLPGGPVLTLGFGTQIPFRNGETIILRAPYIAMTAGQPLSLKRH
jgi:hypothetical protein